MMPSSFPDTRFKRSPWLVGFGFVLIADKPYLLLVRLLVMLNALLG
jgi:hypothetical protein